jgi:hypothetical protein
MYIEKRIRVKYAKITRNKPNSAKNQEKMVISRKLKPIGISHKKGQIQRTDTSNFP